MTIVRNWIVPQIEPRTGVASNPPLITTTSLPNATVGVGYSFTMSATSGTPPYSWSITSDSPNTGNWLSIDPVSGILSGTPGTVETETVLIRVTDSLATPTAPTAFSLTVNPGTGTAWFGATLPTLPQQFSTTSSPPLPANTNRGSYYTPGVGGDLALTLQGALNAAAAATGTRGDVIVLQAGQLYSAGSGTFSMPPRSGSGWIYIMSSQAPELGTGGILPAAGTRITRADIPNMPQLRSTGINTPVISRPAGAGTSFYRWVGMDVELQNVQGTGGNFVIATSAGDTSVSTLASHITYDRCYVAGSPANGSVEGIGLEGNFMEVTECRIERCFQTGNFDSHAIGITNSTGPYKIHNNYMTSSGEITLTGGGDTTLPSPNMPSDITVTNNNYYKAFFGATISTVSGSTTITVSATSGEITPALTILGSTALAGNTSIHAQLTGKPGGVGTYTYGTAASATTNNVNVLVLAWLDKNTVEFKVANRMLFDSNFLECAGGSQQRSAFVITSRNQNGTNPWYMVSDLTVTNNTFTNCYNGGMQWLLQDMGESTFNNPTQPGFRFLLRNNIFILSRAGSGGATHDQSDVSTGLGSVFANLPPNSPSNVGRGICGDFVWDHNTFVAPVTPNGMNSPLIWNSNTTAIMQASRFVWSNNIWDQSQYTTLRGGSPGTGGYGGSVVPQCTNPAFVNNVLTNNGDSTIPSTNFNAAGHAAVGYTNYGSTLQAQGYALTAASAYHLKGMSGTGIPFNGLGPNDGLDIGANISTLPTLALQVTTPNLPDAQVGVAYPGVTLAAKGGTAPYTWTLTAASPNWLRVWGTEGSNIPGGSFAFGAVPQQVETDTITFTVTDSVGANATATFTINVAHA